IARRRTRGIGGVHVVRGDGCRLPFATGSFDVAITVLTLHHFDDADVREVLGEMGRVARERVVANDLERCLPNYVGARLLATTLWRRDPLTRHDGPASVLRSFTPAELRAAGEEAGLRDVRVRRRFPWRLVLEARPPRGDLEAGRRARERRSAGSVS
nr:methyltransferase domain-containing protein [Gemmatimonadota bacterium]NIR81337.1 methyltransferase domain-containing protein [Gemmatimonadota bacterium]NIT90173.1 methyltransferase domain-containing protein [Gemmatimonadota bacterium]NIU34000.1 methyltransferase domain-containing protein [Gemmatimonadota bacterium]NIV64322.1 methyltransferase domain-containing protein [Gemmatimonadota bacterium]